MFIQKLLIFCIFAALLSAEGLKWEHNFHLAQKKAVKQKKELMMLYSAPWCPECNYMKEVAFKNQELSIYLQKHFILLNLDIQKDDLPEGFSYPGIPTFFLIDKKGNEVAKIIGGSKAKPFLKHLKEIR